MHVHTSPHKKYTYTLWGKKSFQYHRSSITTTLVNLHSLVSYNCVPYTRTLSTQLKHDSHPPSSAVVWRIFPPWTAGRPWWWPPSWTCPSSPPLAWSPLRHPLHSLLSPLHSPHSPSSHHSLLLPHSPLQQIIIAIMINNSHILSKDIWNASYITKIASLVHIQCTPFCKAHLLSTSTLPTITWLKGQNQNQLSKNSSLLFLAVICIRLQTSRPWSLICNFYLSVVARKIVCVDLSLRYTSLLLGC